MATIVCPYCQFEMQTQSLRIGRFRPQCKRCQKTFLLDVASLGRPTQMVHGRPIAGDDSPTSLDNEGPSASPRTRAVGQTFQPPPRVETSPPAGHDEPLPAEIGGYRIVSELGRGGLGVVYLAKQHSLQRLVALKVIRSGLKRNATVIARFIREAYAAAQLSHPNIVQIFDMGSEEETHWFSMEYVPGKNLADLILAKGKLPPEQAASFVLQAARGLQYAHQQGMIHRDIKPANLILNPSGVIKVADLGLVKISGDDFQTAMQGNVASTGGELTSFGTTLGTANYMSPEQASDSSRVDHRTDIFALGRTFIALVAGAAMLQSGDPENPTLIPDDDEADMAKRFPRMPKGLATIVQRMTARDPEQRYQNMAGVIRDIEQSLGVAAGQNFHASEQDVAVFEQAANQYVAVPALAFRRWLPPLFLVAAVTLFALAIVFETSWAGPALAMLLTAPLTYLMTSGFASRAYWMMRVRELFFQSRLFFGLSGLFLLLLIAGVMFAGGSMATVRLLLGVMFGIALGVCYFFVTDHALVDQRKGAVNEIQKLLKRLRIHGIDEDAITLFIAKFSGNHWEELFEDLFGYREKRRMRFELARRGLIQRRVPFRPWLDSLVDRMERRLRKEKRARDKRKLMRVERAALRDQGVSLELAQVQADRFIDRLVEEVQEESFEQSFVPETAEDPARLIERRRQHVRSLMQEAKATRILRRAVWQNRMEPQLDVWFGSMFRLATSLVFMVCFIAWACVNVYAQEPPVDVLPASFFPSWGGRLFDLMGLPSLNHGVRPLPLGRFGIFVSGLPVLLASLLSFLGAFPNGWRVSLIVLPGAIAALVLPTMGWLDIKALGGSLGVASWLGVMSIGLAFWLGRKPRTR